MGGSDQLLAGLVFPSERSVRAAQLTGRSVNTPLLLALTTPLPLIRSPVHVAAALHIADGIVRFSLCK